MKTRKVHCREADTWEDGNGGCIGCGELIYGGIEADTRAQQCKACRRRMVYGLGELALMGMLVVAVDDQAEPQLPQPDANLDVRAHREVSAVLERAADYYYGSAADLGKHGIVWSRLARVLQGAAAQCKRIAEQRLWGC